MDVLENGIVAALVVVLWVVVDKVVAPLIRRKNGTHQDDPRWNHQEYINAQHRQQLERHADQIGDVGRAVGTLGAKIDVSIAILDRIENGRRD